MNIRCLVWWKCVISAKSYLPITYSFCESDWFTINGPSKMLFFTFCLFPLPTFLKTFVKNLLMDFEVLSNFYYVTNVFYLHICKYETAKCYWQMLLANQILHILCIFIKPNVWHSWGLKILTIKRWFPFIFAKSLQGRHFVAGGPKNFKLLADIFFEISLENTVLLSLLLFFCACY